MRKGIKKKKMFRVIDYSSYLTKITRYKVSKGMGRISSCRVIECQIIATSLYIPFTNLQVYKYKCKLFWRTNIYLKI